MKIVVLGASGHIGSEITREAAARGHVVTAVARKPEAIPVLGGVTPVAGDASDAEGLAALVKGADVVVSALHHDIPAAVLLSALKTAGVPRLLVTGGAGSLEVAPGVRLIDTPAFPEAFKPYALPGVAFLEDLRGETDIDWTFFSPAALIQEGPRLGVFRTGTDQLIVDDKGQSRISYADYAIAMIDELEQPRHSRARFTAAY
jgi:putative NADH-flavin reductase